MRPYGPIRAHADYPLKGLLHLLIYLMYHFPCPHCHDCSKYTVCMLVGICCEPPAAAHGQVGDGLRPAPVGPMNGLYAKRIPMGAPKGDIWGNIQGEYIGRSIGKYIGDTY